MAVYELRDSAEVAEYHDAELKRHMKWLEEKLVSPACLNDRGNDRAISWFHPDAKEAIERVRAMVEILREYGVVIDQVATDRPGKVIYEDGWQVVAKPFRK